MVFGANSNYVQGISPEKGSTLDIAIILSPGIIPFSWQ